MGYRTLVIRRRVEEIPLEQLIKFLEVQERFRQRATEWYKSGFKAPLPEQNPLKYFAKELKHAMKLLPTNGLKNGVWRVPLPLDAELRLKEGERDNGRGVFVDFAEFRDGKQKEKVIKVRKWSGERGNTIVIRLRRTEVKWIEERIREGAELKFALAWVGKRRSGNIMSFNMALVFHREITPYQPKRLLVVDVNALHNGVVYAVVEERRVLEKSVLKPDLGRIGRLEGEAARLDSLCSTKGIYCNKATALKSRLWRLWRQWTVEVTKKIVKLAMQYKAAIVVDKPLDESIRELKESEKVKPGAKKYLDVGRFAKRLRGLAEWYGVPYREERLHSTICPVCGSKMEELPNRRVRCVTCGFEPQRDEVPIIWAQKKFREILPLFFHNIFHSTIPSTFLLT
ncbi:zinc ribbon domain-containing protein [Pyrobaculum sp. 3827-6]|uniref:zinc ribbon domain-containing protein n=1 Tax=Pyrobaculum sp. 3827-6 TaxID=2983604 RepID=UPI0021DAE6C3|nr:zinc ribbon domain-containing protein [Pyrobaculum sp. 3827-6]MCU7788149.1 zinc ribbon domain-containing protein [Pyrobaculum sp. 3827-6]